MRILSIDIGHYSLKAVEIDSAFNRYEVHEYHEIIRAQGASNESLFSQLSAKLSKKPDRVISTLPTSFTTIRNLSLPTKDKKAILSGVNFELEDDLPFDIDEAIYDYCILGHANNVSQIHVAVTLGEHIAHHLKEFKNTEFDPDLITSESWAFRCLLNRSLDASTQSKPVLLVHAGQTKTVFYCHLNGQPIFSKEIPWGGESVTQHLASVYQISRDEAEQVKTASGYWLSQDQEANATPEQRELSIEIAKASEPLIQEIKKTLFSIRGMTHLSNNHIYLSGGPCLLPGLKAHIESEFQIPVNPLHSLSRLSNSGISYNEQSDCSFAIAAGSVMSMVALDRIKPLQLRKKEFIKHSASTSINWSSYQTPIWGALSVLIAALISFNVQIYSFGSQVKDLDIRLEKALKDYYGSLTRTEIKTYLMNSGSLKSKLTKELNLHRELGKLMTPNPQSPLNYLKDISGQLPRSMVADLVHYQVGSASQVSFIPNQPQEVTVAFQVKSLAMGEKLAQIIERTLVNVKKSSPEEMLSTDGKEQVWKITFTGKTREAK